LQPQGNLRLTIPSPEGRRQIIADSVGVQSWPAAEKWPKQPERETVVRPQGSQRRSLLLRPGESNENLTRMVLHPQWGTVQKNQRSTRTVWRGNRPPESICIRGGKSDDALRRDASHYRSRSNSLRDHHAQVFPWLPECEKHIRGLPPQILRFMATVPAESQAVDGQETPEPQ